MQPMPDYTHKQGQYLAFIYYYTKINCRPPAEADMQAYFGTTPPTIHQMIMTLEEKGFITKVPGKARSIQILLPFSQLPLLD
jgi:repressor LexA